MFKLWLDDIRPAPGGDWIVAKTYTQFVEIITTKGVPDFVSFDHDLGFESDGTEKNGYDCAKWLVDQGIELAGWNVHSANPIGRANIDKLLKRHKQFKETGK